MSELFTVTCGCGFSFSSDDPEINRMALNDHDCSNESGIFDPPSHWTGYVFSLSGAAFMIGLGLAVMGIIYVVKTGQLPFKFPSF